MKKHFIKLLKSTERKDIDLLIKWLEEETDFFTAPASSKYHLSYEGGLLEHSINVFDELMREHSPADLKELNTNIIVSLLHDICKANYYKVSYRNVKNNEGKWVQEPYYSVEDAEPLGHGEKSVILIQKFIKLTDEEIMAIRWHMGGFEAKDNYTYLSKAFNQSELALKLHIADLKATYLIENKESKESKEDE